MGGPVAGAGDITYLLAHHIRCKRTVALWRRCDVVGSIIYIFPTHKIRRAWEKCSLCAAAPQTLCSFLNLIIIIIFFLSENKRRFSCVHIRKTQTQQRDEC